MVHLRTELTVYPILFMGVKLKNCVTTLELSQAAATVSSHSQLLQVKNWAP